MDEIHDPVVTMPDGTSREPARGAIARHGGLLKMISRTDDLTVLAVHGTGDATSDLVGLGRVVRADGATASLVAVARESPTRSTAGHGFVVDGLARLADAIGHRTGQAFGTGPNALVNREVVPA